MDAATLFRRSAATVNKAMLPLLRTAPARKVMGGSFATLTYTGRKSGKQIALPVNYRRDGSDIVIGVMGPDAKKWWRNFTGPGAPVHVAFGSEEHDGHAVASRAGKRVTVRVTFG